MNCEECQKPGVEAELIALKKENEKLRTVPMKYRRMRFNAELQARNDALESETAALNEKLKKTEAALKEARDRLRPSVEALESFLRTDSEARDWVGTGDRESAAYDEQAYWKELEELISPIRALAEKEG